MATKIYRQISLNTSWGKVAMMTCGDPLSTPVLLVHGYMDSAATFLLLLDELPNDYYYVAFDLPGHGFSDPFPPGLVISQLHMVEVIRIIVDNMKWDKFIYIGHSMGCVIGIFYDFLFPGKISKCIQLDSGLAISAYYYVHFQPYIFYQYIYNEYYENFKRWNSDSSKLYTLEQAINLLVRTRSLTEEQAEVVLSRSLIPVEKDLFKLSWEPRMKKISNIPVSADILHHIISSTTSPTLILESSDSFILAKPKEFLINILDKCEKILPNFIRVTVPGGHDVHITNSEVVASHIKPFLKRNFDNDNRDANVQSKL